MDKQLKDILTTKEWIGISNKINAIFILGDVQESLILEVEKALKGKGELKFDVKHYVNQIIKSSRLLVEQVNKLAPIHNDSFASSAEKMREIVDKEFLN